MKHIHAETVVSISELRRNTTAVMEAAQDVGAIAILSHNEPTGYVLSAEAYESIVEMLHDLRDAELVEKRLKQMREGKTVKVSIDDL